MKLNTLSKKYKINYTSYDETVKVNQSFVNNIVKNILCKSFFRFMLATKGFSWLQKNIFTHWIFNIIYRQSPVDTRHKNIKVVTFTFILVGKNGAFWCKRSKQTFKMSVSRKNYRECILLDYFLHIAYMQF